MSVISVKSNFENYSVFYMVNTSTNILYTWGKNDKGGAVPGNPNGLKTYVKDAIISSGNAAAYINTSGQIMKINNWGNSSWGGYNNFTAPTSNTGFEKLYEAGEGLMARKADNTFHGWGSYVNNTNFLAAINNKKTLFFDVASNRKGAALLFNDGTVISTGSNNNLKKGYSGYNSITGVSQLFASHDAFAALKTNGTIIFWGDSYDIGTGSANSAANISKVYSSTHAVVVITNDNKLYSKGSSSNSHNFTGSTDYGIFSGYISNVKLDDNYPTVAFNYHPIKQGIQNYVGSGGFGYITTDGKLGFKGDIAEHSSLTDNGFTPNKFTDISNCMAIYSTSRAYAIVHTDKRTITLFGRGYADNTFYGGDQTELNFMVTHTNSSYNPTTLPSDIKKVFSTGKSFIFLKDDGTENNTYSIILINGNIKYYDDYPASLRSQSWFGNNYFDFTGDFAGMNTGIVDVVTTYDSMVFIKSDGKVFWIRYNNTSYNYANGPDWATSGYTFPKWISGHSTGYNPSKNIGASSSGNKHNEPWIRNTLSRSKTMVDVSNAIIGSTTYFSSKDLTDYFANNAIDFNSATDSDIEGFLSGVYNTANTTNITTNLALKLINLLSAKTSVIINKLYTLLNTASQTVTLANVLTVTEKTIFDAAKIVDISGGNTTPTAIEKEIFKGLKELSFRKLRQDLKGTSLETKIKDISANDVDTNLTTYLSSINTNLSLNLTGMDLSGLNLTNTDLSGATLVNTDFSGTILTGANLQGADVSGTNLSNVNFKLADFTNLQNFTKTTGIAKNLPSTHQYYLNQPVLSTQNLSVGSYVATSDTAGPFKDGESISVNGVQITFGTSISEAGLLGINKDADGGSYTFIKDDNTLNGWGNPYKGADIPSDISNVKAIFSTKNAKSVICNDGKVFSWGNADEGATVPTDLSGIIDIQSNEKAFVGLYHNGDIICWGDSATGGTTPTDVSNVIQLYSNKNAFSVLQSDGSIKSWGTLTGTAPTTKNFIDIYSTNTAFAALDASGNVSCWGSSDSTQNTPPTDLSNVSIIYGNDDAFAALIADGTVKCWGNTTNGGTTPTDISNVDYISNTNTAFTAITNDGEAICWGNSTNGGTKPTTYIYTDNEEETVDIAVTADSNGVFKFSGYNDSSANLFFINNETQKEAGININKDFYFFNTKNHYDDIVYISNKEYNNSTDHTFTFKTLKDSWCLNNYGNTYIRIGFIYTSGGKDYTSYRHSNIFNEDNCPHYYINNPAWIKTEEKTLTLKLLSNKMTLEGHDGVTVYEDTNVSSNPSNYKLAISIYNGIIKLENTYDVSYPALKCGVRYKFDQSDSSNAGNTLKFSAYDISGELIEDSTKCYGTPGSTGSYTILHNTDIERKELYPYSVEKGLDAGKKHKKIYFDIETIVVTVVSNKFVFNGNNSITPDISHNIYYKFDVSHSSNTNHKLSFSKGNNTTDYNVNRKGIAGSAGSYVTFKNNNPNNTDIYVFCKTHGTGMGSHYNPINIGRIKKTLSLSNINKVFSTKTAFSALKNDKTIVAWGDISNGGNYTETSQTYENLTNKSKYDINDYVKITNSGIVLVTKSGGFWTSNYDSYFGPTHATYGLKNNNVSDIMSGIKKLIVNKEAICVLKNNNSVITWGNNEYNKIFSYGGNSSNLQSFLTSNIKDIIKTEKAFCALNNDGKIITWGHSNYGGDYKHKYDEITDISSISSNIYSMAAISKTGKLYTWGEYGRYHNNQWAGLTSTNYKKDMTDSSAYESKVNSGVTDVYYNDAAGIAIKDDGNGFKKICAYWGHDTMGGNPSHSTQGIRNHSGNIDLTLLDSHIKEIFVRNNTFFILNNDNKLYGWGDYMNTSNIDNTKLATLTDISSVHFTISACAALKINGEVITWGTNSTGGDKADGTYGVRNTSGNVDASLLNSSSGVISISSNLNSFCALKSDGTVLCWGNQNKGGNPYNTTEGQGMVKDMATSDMHSFVKITNTVSNKKFYSMGSTIMDQGFAGLRSDGAIIVWGINSEIKGSMTATDLKNARNFVDIKGGDYYGVFAGIKSDGSVALFGNQHRSSWYRGNNYYATWNANYKEGHVHLPGTMRKPDVLMTNSITKLTETTVVEKNKFKNISATDKAFAAIKDTGDLVVWGEDDYGGKQTDLSGHTNFTHIFSNRGTFAGLKDDQTMHNWGNKNYGGIGGPSTDIKISPNLQEINQYTESYRKSNILSEFGINADTKKINDYSFTSNAEANALINIDGTVDTWGNTAFGGLTTNISNNLNNVKEIITGGGVMTALKADGTTTTWKNNTVYETNKPTNLNNIKKIVSGSDGMVVALKADGTVTAWHNASNTWDLCGNIASNNLTNLSGIVDIYASNKCFAALKYDNSLYVWGSKENSSNRIINNISSQVSKLTSGVKEVFVNGKVLIALKYDGTVVTIGNANNGGDISNNDAQYKLYGGTATDITDVFLNDKFAIGLKKDNSCIYWGDISRNTALFNNDITTFTNIKTIVYSKDVMIGIKFNGRIVGLGEKNKGAETPLFKEAVSKVYATTNNGFSLLKTNSEVISWGDTSYGGQII